MLHGNGKLRGRDMEEEIGNLFDVKRLSTVKDQKNISKISLMKVKIKDKMGKVVIVKSKV